MHLCAVQNKFNGNVCPPIMRLSNLNKTTDRAFLFYSFFYINICVCSDSYCWLIDLYWR